jgi:hypothetical protein
MRKLGWFWVAASVGFCLQVGAQNPPEKERVLCDPAVPENGCPGADCVCAPDTLEVTFDGDTGSVFEYETFQDGMTIDVTIVTETASEKVQGWSYGVAHDPEAVELVEVTAAYGLDELCVDPPCNASRVPGGWISGIILVPGKTTWLQIRRNKIAWAKYALKKDVGPEGTLIRFSDQLAYKDSPPAGLNLTINGRSKLWSTGVDGWIKRKGEAPPFRRGDADGSGDINILDAILALQSLFGGWKLPTDCDDALDSNDDGKLSILDALFSLAYVFQHGPGFPAPFTECGPDPTPDALACLESACGVP